MAEQMVPSPEHKDLLNLVIGGIVTMIGALGGPKLWRFLTLAAKAKQSAESIRVGHEDKLREELRQEQSELREEMRTRIDELEAKLTRTADELAEWKQKYFKLDGDYRVLQLEMNHLRSQVQHPSS